LKKRLHRNIILAIEETLIEIFEKKRYADRVLEQILKGNPLWGARDRKHIAEVTYEIVRWWTKICYAAKIHKNDPDKYRKAISAWHMLDDEYEIPDWLWRIDTDEKSLRNAYFKSNPKRSIAASIPEWLDELGETELGDDWNRELNALNEQAQLIIRVNTLKISKLDLQKKLSLIDIDSQQIAGHPDALIVPSRQNLFKTDAFKEGLFEIQDASSQLVGAFSEIEPGMRVIDACAGGGGKSLHIAALMQNKGTIISMDVEQWKLNELKKRARRNGVSIIETRIIDNSKAIKRLYDKADRVILDVPCSGLGVLKRNPDAKWKLNLTFIEELKIKQQEILVSYSRMVKPNGKLVYATCSILPSENTKQVEKFLANHPNFTLEEERIVKPSEGFDGFYMARMNRNT